MPIYIYRCDKCSDEIEIISTKIGDTLDNLVCDCGGTFQKVPSSSSFKINGYSYSNGYSGPEEVRYDGSTKQW